MGGEGGSGKRGRTKKRQKIMTKYSVRLESCRNWGGAGVGEFVIRTPLPRRFPPGEFLPPSYYEPEGRARDGACRCTSMFMYVCVIPFLMFSRCFPSSTIIIIMIIFFSCVCFAGPGVCVWSPCDEHKTASRQAKQPWRTYIYNNSKQKWSMCLPLPPPRVDLSFLRRQPWRRR